MNRQKLVEFIKSILIDEVYGYTIKNQQVTIGNTDMSEDKSSWELTIPKDIFDEAWIPINSQEIQIK